MNGSGDPHFDLPPTKRLKNEDHTISAVEEFPINAMPNGSVPTTVSTSCLFLLNFLKHNSVHRFLTWGPQKSIFQNTKMGIILMAATLVYLIC